jgi:hypothetical protein
MYALHHQNLNWSTEFEKKLTLEFIPQISLLGTIYWFTLLTKVLVSINFYTIICTNVLVCVQIYWIQI